MSVFFLPSAAVWHPVQPPTRAAKTQSHNVICAWEDTQHYCKTKAEKQDRQKGPRPKQTNRESEKELWIAELTAHLHINCMVMITEDYRKMLRKLVSYWLRHQKLMHYVFMKLNNGDWVVIGTLVNSDWLLETIMHNDWLLRIIAIMDWSSGTMMIRAWLLGSMVPFMIELRINGKLKLTSWNGIEIGFACSWQEMELESNWNVRKQKWIQIKSTEFHLSWQIKSFDLICLVVYWTLNIVNYITNKYIKEILSIVCSVHLAW